MPQRKQPKTLFAIALPITAVGIRYQCDAILRNYGDVTQSAFQGRIESFNEHLKKEVPIHVLNRIRQHQNLAVFIYHQVKTLTVQDKTLRNTPIHQHLILNVFPRLDRVTFLDLSMVEGSLELFQAISTNCRELQSILINTLSGEIPCGDTVAMWLLTLTTCKKLKVIRNSIFKFGFLRVGSSRLPNHVTLRILQELPELEEFKCDITSILDNQEMLVDVYYITQLTGNAESAFTSPENIQWLNRHCPFINQVKLSSINDPTLLALSFTDWKIKSLEFEYITSKFSETMKFFFTYKGMFIENLYLFFYVEESLSYDNIVWISLCCPVLKELMFGGIWYNREALIPIQRRTARLFPNLERFSIDVFRHYLVMPVILEALSNLRELECIVMGTDNLVFKMLNTIAGLRNPFNHLEKVTIKLFHRTPDTTSMFVQRFVPIAMGWKNIRHIEVGCYDDDLLPEAVQYLEETKSAIKEHNLDVTLNVG